MEIVGAAEDGGGMGGFMAPQVVAAVGAALPLRMPLGPLRFSVSPPVTPRTLFIVWW